jgi:uncharacterized surface protein with fasciclin (FAS1) repeats
MRFKFLGVAAITAGLALGAAACGSSSSSAPSSSAPKATSSAQPAASASGSAMAPFGPACSSVPASGAGSFSGMSTAPVATAASNNPVLSTLVTAVKKAGLVDTLNSASGITVFAPDNSAFAKIPASTLNSVLGNKAELTKILTYHVASGRITPAQLASGQPIKTLEGSTVMPSKMGSTYEVNSAHVVCGDVQTANATVYIVDTVLMPPSS